LRPRAAAHRPFRAANQSLSAVANAITGTNWNGFAFFGIKRAPSGNKNAAGPRRIRPVVSSDVDPALAPNVKFTGSRRNA
jgi:hypothetical protein